MNEALYEYLKYLKPYKRNEPGPVQCDRCGKWKDWETETANRSGTDEAICEDCLIKENAELREILDECENTIEEIRSMQKTIRINESFIRIMKGVTRETA